jgi:hypothetical protein
MKSIHAVFSFNTSTRRVLNKQYVIDIQPCLNSTCQKDTHTDLSA